ncbi:hypothetical protein GUJ93_ZPchr0894g2881 [Zizania palustris]|uniref:Uncharacterized protein n=1 Tax=Zizania palustris TaxID=103762 RepID=A0A8J5RAK8_ZIZPA|nr:hypothetical protein GUJ93_ZPchr0894g2881 [Zizania palustris]
MKDTSSEASEAELAGSSCGASSVVGVGTDPSRSIELSLTLTTISLAVEVMGNMPLPHHGSSICTGSEIFGKVERGRRMEDSVGDDDTEL